MPAFCVNMNPQSTGEHEVHDLSAGCSHLPDPSNRLSLGHNSTCKAAVAKARQHYAQVDGCKYCAPDCHRR